MKSIIISVLFFFLAKKKPTANLVPVRQKHQEPLCSSSLQVTFLVLHDIKQRIKHSSIESERKAISTTADCQTQHLGVAG